MIKLSEKCVKSGKGGSGYIDHFEVAVSEQVTILLVDSLGVGVFGSG